MKFLPYVLTAFLTLILFFITGCSFQQQDFSFEYNPYEKEEKRFAKLLDQSVFEIDDERILRLEKNRFMIYDDVETAPVSFGTLFLAKGKLHLKMLDREEIYTVKSKSDQFILSSPTKVMHLTPDYTENFYKPKTIFEAIRWGDLEDVKRLVAQGASIEQADALGTYPLMEAIYYGHDTIAEYLILMGVDLLVQNYSGLTALHLALETDNKKIVALLLEKGAKEQLTPCKDLLTVLQQDDFDPIKLLIDAGYNPSCQQSTLLFWLISHATFTQEQQLAYLNYLLAKGIRVDAVSSKQGDTPLMRAAGFGKEILLQRLIDYGVDLFITDRQGRTALDFDSIYIEKKNPDIEKILKSAGLNTGIKAKADQAYEAALALLKDGNALEAYWQLLKLGDEYKNENYYHACIKAGLAVEKPTLGILKNLVTLLERYEHEDSRAYYQQLISIYMRMQPLVADDARKEDSGAFKKDTLFFVVKEMDLLYDKLLRFNYSTKNLYDKYLNLKKLNNYSGISRGDMTNGAGSRFIGETLHGKPFGKGSLKYRDGSSYYGIVIDYKRHGQGKMTYKDGTIYDGTWENDQRQGKGFFTDTYNALYLGTFKKDKLLGEAKMVRPGKRPW